MHRVPSEYRVGTLLTEKGSFSFIEITNLGEEDVCYEVETAILNDFEKHQTCTCATHRCQPGAMECLPTFVQFPLLWGEWHAMEAYQGGGNRIQWHTYHVGG